MIYFLLRPRTHRHPPLIKIGWTERMPRRLSALAGDAGPDDEDGPVEWRSSG